MLQVLKGNDVNQVAKELDVSVERLNRWKDLFVEGGKAALEERSHENTALARRRRQRQKIVQWALIIVALIIGLAALIRFVTSIRSGVGESS